MARAGILDNYRDTIVRVVTEQTLAALSVELPFFALPVIRQITYILLSKFYTFLLDKTILGINLGIIDITLKAEVDKLNKLLDKAKNLPDEKKEELPQLEDEIAKAARDLITLRDKFRV